MLIRKHYSKLQICITKADIFESIEDQTKVVTQITKQLSRYKLYDNYNLNILAINLPYYSKII